MLVEHVHWVPASVGVGGLSTKFENDNVNEYSILTIFVLLDIFILDFFSLKTSCPCPSALYTMYNDQDFF